VHHIGTGSVSIIVGKGRKDLAQLDLSESANLDSILLSTLGNQLLLTGPSEQDLFSLTPDDGIGSIF
jgi:hypothetical protein